MGGLERGRCERRPALGPAGSMRCGRQVERPTVGMSCELACPNGVAIRFIAHRADFGSMLQQCVFYETETSAVHGRRQQGRQEPLCNVRGAQQHTSSLELDSTFEP